MSDATGIEIWTNTGLYAAGDHKYLPEYAHRESAEQLAKRWILEAQRGVDGMKPRFIKIGVNRGYTSYVRWPDWSPPMAR